METMKGSERKWYSVNMRLLPLKLNYLLFAAGVASFSPYLPLHAKQVGLSSTAIGILYTTVSAVSLVAKPFFGWVTDKYRREKLLATAMLIISIAFYLVIAFISPIESTQSIQVQLNCSHNSPRIMELNNTCSSAPNRTKNCRVSCRYNELTGKANGTLEQDNVPVFFSDKQFVIIKQNGSNLNCRNNSSFNCTLYCPCDKWCCLEDNEYITSAFWMFFLCFFFVGIGERVLRGLNDSICFNILGNERTEDYGRQRLWFVVGLNLAPFLTGYLVDITKHGNTYNYAVAVYTLVAFMAVDIAVVCKLDFGTTQRRNKSETIWKDIYSLVSQFKYLVYALTTCVGGMASGFDVVYYNLFMEEIGASKMFIGITIATCLIIQIPIIFFAGDVIRKIGHFNSFALSLILISIRFLTFSFIYEPLWALFPQIFLRSGIDFFVVCCTSYAQIVAPPGTESTSQQIGGALFGGVGVGLGYALGGLGFDYFGSRSTFIIASVLAAFASIINFSFSIFSKPGHKGKDVKKPVVDEDDPIEKL